MNKNAEPVVVNFKKNTIAPYVVSKNKNIILIVSLIILLVVGGVIVTWYIKNKDNTAKQQMTFNSQMKTPITVRN